MTTFKIGENWGLGDKLCLLSAARVYGRIHKNKELVDVDLPDVLRCLWPDFVLFKHEIYGHGPIEPVVHLNKILVPMHRDKTDAVRALTYYGTYLKALNVFDYVRPHSAMDLPNNTTTGCRSCEVCIATHSIFAPDAPRVYIQRCIDTVYGVTDRPLMFIGNRKPGEAPYEHVDYSRADQGIPALLHDIERAGLLLTPRSAPAHIAAAYNTPTFAWLPGDGEDWHLNYQPWYNVRLPYQVDPTNALRTLVINLMASGRLLHHKEFDSTCVRTT
jgi:hypothetical protein